MNPKYLGAILMIALSLTLGIPAEAQSGSGTIGGVSNGVIVGAIVGVAVGITAVVIVAVHYSKKRTITGCVNSQGSDMTVTDEKTRQVYVLSGNTVSIKPGDRRSLTGKKVKSSDPGGTYRWEASKVAKDFGVCQP